MKNIGVIGIGDMGSGLAKNLLKAGFSVRGHDLLDSRMQAFAEMGGEVRADAADVGRDADAVFLMIMNGDEARSVIFGDPSGQMPEGQASRGLVASLAPGSVILLTATVTPKDARELAAGLQGTGIDIIDTPVSGGFPGAQSGTLTMMAAAPDELLEKCKPVMQAVSNTIHPVGTEIGMGQTVKACLQSLIGAIFSATFEATVLAAKAGVDGEALRRVISNSSAGCVVANTSLENILAREFENTGSHIRTMYKDLTIVMDVAREMGVPLFTASTAMQLFQAGITRYPNGDNWAVTQISEEIVGAALNGDTTG